MTSAITNLFSSEETPPPNFEISAPYNFKHTTHVQIDPHTSTGFSVSRFSLLTKSPHLFSHTLSHSLLFSF